MKPTSMVGDKGSWSKLQSLPSVNIRPWQLCSATLEDDFWSNVEKLVIEPTTKTKIRAQARCIRKGLAVCVELRVSAWSDAAAVEYFESVTRSPQVLIYRWRRGQATI